MDFSVTLIINAIVNSLNFCINHKIFKRWVYSKSIKIIGIKYF